MSKSARSAKKSANKPSHPLSRPPQQVRIIGGVWKRSLLPVLDAAGLRPTPDRVRETVFNWIRHLRDGVQGARCLDLFAGSGALGFEAASRGALEVTLVEVHTPAFNQLEANKAKFNATQVNIIRGDALAAAQHMAARGQQFDLIFLDPPYQQGWLERVLPLCERLLAAGGLIYAESARTLNLDELPPGEAAPEWLLPWQVVRADQAGMVFYQLLQRKTEHEILPNIQA